MLFQKSIIKKYVATLPTEEVNRAWKTYQSYFLDPDIQANICESKEEQFQEGFLRELFVNVLGYTLNPSPNYNLITERKNETNTRKADGAIIADGKVIGVIELKDHKTADLAKIEQQAFGYKSQNRHCRYVVTSNFEKLRLYIDNAVEHREWSLFTMTETDFCELYLCLAWEQVAKGIPAMMKGDSLSTENQVTQALYHDYSQFKTALFQDILRNNPKQPIQSDFVYAAKTSRINSINRLFLPHKQNTDDTSVDDEGMEGREWTLLLFKKTQKLLDRFLFILFAEDCGLLPPNSMLGIIQQWQQMKEWDEYRPLYDRIKKFFGYLDKGHKGKDTEIFAYNGGLFKPDEVLDRLVISDGVLEEHTQRLAAYDYESDVDVNILGHIFEHSLSEIEDLRLKIEDDAKPTNDAVYHLQSSIFNLQSSKRKQDGIFYTPRYITKYIVENTVGRLCTEKKRELEIEVISLLPIGGAARSRQKEERRQLLERLREYREWLLQLTILDPACGSGAFLNAALVFLVAEHRLIDEMEAQVTGSTLVFQDVENSILENNLFGVDINEESVEIAQLSLWLRTAKPHRKLNTLSQNIKCGNSLIAPTRPICCGFSATTLHPFDWQREFPQVFAKGGFDVVIGNPPYVQLQGMGDQGKAYAECGFEVYNKSADLYCLFYEQGCKLLKDKGMLGFIASNKWLKINYGMPLRKYITTKMNPLLLIDFPGVPVFEDATVDPQILVAQKAPYMGKTFAYAAKDKTDEWTSMKDNDMVELSLTSEPWVIRDAHVNAIVNKIDSCGTALKDLPITINYGIKTGYNDAFFIDEETKNKLTDQDPKAEEIIRPLLRGRDITAWIAQNQDILYLINVHNGIRERGIPPINIDDYPIVKEHLDQFIDQLKKRGDKGETPYNLRNCAYLEEFAKPKIVYPNMTKFLPFCYDDSGAVCNDKAFIITAKDEGISLKYLLAILNSKLAKFWIRSVCPELGDDRREIRKVYFENFHVPLSAPQPLASLADEMLSLHRQLHERHSRFLRRVAGNMQGIKVNNALAAFYQMDFTAFLNELKRQKFHLSPMQQDEWEEYFHEYQSACLQLARQIQQTSQAIDTHVCHLYGLTEVEVATVNSTS
ncbi:MAG: N-6 DNA methylase [Prevotella sp.]|nr:N-6 DNA methylase [Prevotella sp.]